MDVFDLNTFKQTFSEFLGFILNCGFLRLGLNFVNYSLQRELYQRFKSKWSGDITSDGDSSVSSDSITIEHKSSASDSNADNSSAVNTNESIEEETISVHKFDSDGGDIEDSVNEMAEVQNGTENEGGDKRAVSLSEQTEADDKFPQQMSTKNANWNTMELGEKRKRLRWVFFTHEFWLNGYPIWNSKIVCELMRS